MQIGYLSKFMAVFDGNGPAGNQPKVETNTRPQAGLFNVATSMRYPGLGLVASFPVMDRYLNK
jgi:hypothetical protein